MAHLLRQDQPTNEQEDSETIEESSLSICVTLVHINGKAMYLKKIPAMK